MSTITLKTGEIIPASACNDVMQKLPQMERDDPAAFYRLIKGCRNLEYKFKQCSDYLSLAACISDKHPKCWDLEPYLGLIESLNEKTHAQINPVVRALVLATTQTSGALFPKFVSLALPEE